MVLHKNLTGDDLHVVKAHTHTESEISDLKTYLTEADADLLYSVLAHTHVAADVTDFDPADYLPLAAGSGSPLTDDLYIDGNLRIENGSYPQIILDTGGAGTNVASIIQDVALLYIRKSRDAGDVYLDLEHKIEDNISDGFTRLFRNTTTSGNCKLQIMPGDGSSNVQHEFDAGGNVNLCQQAGTIQQDGVDVALSTDLDSYLPLTAGPSESLTGDLEIDKTTPKLTLRRDGGASSFLEFSDSASLGYIKRSIFSGDSYLLVDSIPVDGTSDSFVDMFYSTNTSGDQLLRVWRGGAVPAIQHSINGKAGDVSLCMLNGGLTVGGFVQLPYLGAAPSGLTNGMIWMESDGLHLYYNSTEKIVAGA